MACTAGRAGRAHLGGPRVGGRAPTVRPALAHRSLLNNVLAGKGGRRVAVIENELGEVNVDGQLGEGGCGAGAPPRGGGGGVGV